MKKISPWALMKTHPGQILFLSCGGIGFLPFAPGTWASLATLPFLYFLGTYQVPIVFVIPIMVTLTILSGYIADICQRREHIHDPGWIVIDENLGMIVTWLFHPSARLIDLSLAFVFFRFFDIVKFWPASYFDKKVTHGLGTILDDICSGIYAGILYAVTSTYFVK